MNDFWSMSGSFIYRHHVEPRVKLYSPREESFTIPLKYIEVSRTAHTNLDVRQERRIDDYWNIDGSRDLSDPWTGFHTIYSTRRKKLLTDILGPGRDWRESSLHPGQIIYGQSYGSQWERTPSWRRNKKWSEEKIHLDNARKLRGIYFIDPEDKEFKETIKNARKKLETSVAPAMPCKIMKNCGSGASDKKKTKLACILEADESTSAKNAFNVGATASSTAPADISWKKVQPTETPPVKLYSPREESFTIPLKYIDVSRTAHTNLDVKQERRIDDYWNIDGSRDLSDPWTGFTQFTPLEVKSSWRIYLVRGEIDEKTAYIQARSSMARVMEVNGKERQAEGETKSGLKKRFILTTQENCVESISSTPRIRSTRKPSRTHVRNWKRQLLLLCLVKLSKVVGVIDEARTSGATVHFAKLMDICHLKNAELEAKHQKYKGRVVLRGDIVKDNSGSYAVFTEQGSSASQMTAAKIMDIISKLPGCDGQAADALSACTQVKWKMLTNYWKFPNRSVQTFGFVYHDTIAKIMVQYGRPSCSSWTESVRSSFGRTFMGKAIWENPIKAWLGENSKLWMSLCSSWKRIILFCVCGWHTIGWKETKCWSDVEITQQKKSIWKNQQLSWIMCIGLHSTTMRNKQT